MLVAQPQGNCRFLPSEGGRVPFCSAVIAEPGYEIVRATLERPIPYEAGFQLIEAHLTALGRPRQALCGVELRCAQPYTRDGFNEFNGRYAELLRGWGLFGDGVGSTARTNIAPALSAPTEQVLFAVSYTVPSTSDRPTFVLSGAAAGGVGEGDPAPEMVHEKVAHVVSILEERLTDLGLGWDATTEIVAYAPHDIEAALRAAVLPRIGPAVLNGVRWYPGRAPVIGTDIELGTHGVRQEIRVAVR